MSYVIISDTLIDAWSPLSETVTRRYRDNIEAVWQGTIVGPMSAKFTDSVNDGDGDEGVWHTLGTLQIYVPGQAVGQNGTRLLVYADLECTNNSQAHTATAEFRLALGADTSNEITVTNGSSSSTVAPTNQAFTLDTTAAAGGAVEDIDVEVKIILSETAPIGTTTGTFLWGPTTASGLLRSQD